MTALWPRLVDLLACAVVTLDANAATDDTLQGAPPDRRFVLSGGQVAWDDCCENGGQVWVRVVQAWPYQTFPAKALSGAPCADEIATQLAVGVLRCVRSMDDQGGAPTGDQITREAHQMVSDMAALLAAVDCCVADNDEIMTVDRWAPQGALGGCAGGEWTLWVPSEIVYAPFEVAP